jgi:peptide-methionine (S)-S-oxide reductase
MNPTTTPEAVRRYDERAPGDDETRTATFALGCFWGPDARFGSVGGVHRTRVGYAGGSEEDPTYADLGDHTESVQVDYDPEAVSYTDLLGIAFEEHDPRRRVAKRQYQNAVFVTGDQREAVERYIEETAYDPDRVETRVERLDGFHIAEGYHQKHSLRSRGDLLGAFEDAGYSDEEVRESPAAASLNGFAAGHGEPNALVTRGRR